MKNKIFIFCFVYLFLTHQNCTRQPTIINEFNPTAIKIDPRDSKERVYSSNIFHDIKYIQLESPENHLIGEISGLIYFKDRFYILDSEYTKSIFCFEKNGRFLFEIKRIGQGPGEYLNPSSISIDEINNHLLVYCRTSHQVLIFDLVGNFLKSIKLDFFANHFAYLSEDKFVFFCDFTHSNRRLLKNHLYPNLIITNSKGKIIDTAFPYSDKINYSLIPTSTSLFNTLQNVISVSIPYNDTIYHISNRNLKRAFSIDFGRYTKDKKFYDQLYDGNLTFADLHEYLNMKKMCNIFQFVETNSDLFLIYTHVQTVHFCFYDKDTQTFIDASNEGKEINPFLALVDDIYGGPFPVPYFSDNDKMYSYLNPYDLMNYEKTIREYGQKDNRLLSIIDKMTEEDNPIICIMNLK
jgi:hypothetical protein